MYHFRKLSTDRSLGRLNSALNKTERKRIGKKETPGMFSIDCQSIMAGLFPHHRKGIDGNERINGRKRHVMTDTLALIKEVVADAAHPVRRSGYAKRLVEPLSEIWIG